MPISEVAPVMRKAVIAIEDSRFYEHGGIDLRGTLRAFVNNQSGEDVQGGSTLTQQYVKQVLLEAAANIKDEKKRAEAQKAATAQSYTRKLRELRYAVALEEKYTKEQILERYLNIAYFGAGAYGVEAAAKRYFSTHARDLTLAAGRAARRHRAAADGVRPDPQPGARRWPAATSCSTGWPRSGWRPSRRSTRRRPPTLDLKPSKRSRQNGCQDSKVAFFCDFVLKTIQNDKAFGAERDRTGPGCCCAAASPSPRPSTARRRSNAQESLADHVEPDRRGRLRAGVGAARHRADPGDGGQPRLRRQKKGEIKFNPATDRAYGGSSGFQAGSTFKPFVAAAALEKGYPFSYPIYAPYQADIGDVQGCNETLHRRVGARTTRPAARTAPTRCRPASRARSTPTSPSSRSGSASAGRRQIAESPRHAPRRRQAARRRSSRSRSGVDEVSPLSMAEAYATFAARGMHCNSIAILEVTDPSGNRLPVPQADCKQVLDQDIADGINELLQGVIERGTGTRAAIGRPAAGKTGTTNRRVSVWFVGYTPDLATAVWAGNPSPPTGGYPLQNRLIGGVYYGDVCGGCLPGPDLAADDEQHAGRHPGVVVHRRRRRRPSRRRDHGAVGHRQVGRARPRRCCARPSSTRWSAATGSTSTTPRPGTVAYSYPGSGDAGLPRAAGRHLRQRRPAGRGAEPETDAGRRRRTATAAAAATGAADPTARRRTRRRTEAGVPAAAGQPAESAQPASCRRTSAATRPPSARPAVCGVTAFIT